MESVIQAQVLGVTSRSTSNGRTIYEVQAGDGNKYATFKSEVAQKAANLQGQMASLLVKVEQKGNYTNFYLNDAGPVGTLAAPTPAAGGVITTAQPGTPGVITPVSGGGGGGGMSPEREAKIVRQSSTSTAFAFVGALYQGAGPEALKDALAMAKGLAEGLGQYALTGLWPGGVAQPTLDVPHTPEGVAMFAQAAGADVQVGAPQEAAPIAGGDDIPWD